MPIEPIKPEVLEASQAQLKDELIPKAPRQVANTENAITLGVDTRFHYRGRPFLLQPLPFRAGAELQKLRIALTETAALMDNSETAVGEYADLSQQAIDVIWRHSIPSVPVKALLKKIRLARNPLRGATDGEVMDLVNFFLSRRMLSSVRKR